MQKINYTLVLLLIFGMPWENISTFSGIGTISRLVGAALAAAWLTSLLLTGRIRSPRPFHLAVYLFFLLNAASIYWTINVTETLERTITYVQLAILVVAIWDVVRSRVQFEGVMQAYVAGAFVSILSIFQNSQSAVGEMKRVAASGFNEDDIGLILALGLPMAWYLALFAERRAADWLWRSLNLCYVPLAVLAMMLTGTRGSLIASVPTAIFMLATAVKASFKTRIALAVLCVALVTCVPWFVPKHLIARLGTTRESIESGDMNGRGKIWANALLVFRDRPLLGAGANTFRPLTGRAAHNVYLSVVVDLGLIGLALLLTIAALVTHEALRQPSWPGRLCMTMLCTLALGTMVLTWEQRKQTWLILSLVVASANIERQRERVEGVVGVSPPSIAPPREAKRLTTVQEVWRTA